MIRFGEDEEPDDQRWVWAALIKHAWRRGRDFVVLRAAVVEDCVR